MTPRRVVLLGATGSIGTQAVDVIARFPERFALAGVVAGRDIQGLRAIADRFGVTRVAVVDPEPGAAVPAGLRGVGLDAACEIAAMPSDTVCVAITGAAGALRPTLAALDAGNTVATATKEVLVMAGDTAIAHSRAGGARHRPHRQRALGAVAVPAGEEPSSVARLISPPAGGPSQSSSATFRDITPGQALRHPTWNMGPKVRTDANPRR